MLFTKKQIQDLEGKIEDTSLPLEERKLAYKDLMSVHLNPLPESDFNPETFNPVTPPGNLGKIAQRERITPPRRLPTMGLKPKEILEGQMVGMFESKQDLYLLIAWLSNRVSDLEDQINKNNQ